MTLTVNRLHFGYQHKAIFKEISLSIPQGKLVGIVGPNGGGKSTLLKLLAGQEQPQSGEILLKGKPLGSYGMKALARELAYLPQRPLVPPGIRVEQLVQYGRHPHQGWFTQWSEEDARMVDWARERMQLDASGSRAPIRCPAARPSGCGSPWCWPRMRISSCWTSPPAPWT